MSDERVRKPMLSVVVPVWREERTVGPLIAHLRGLDARGNCEIIVVDGDGGSTLRAISDPGVIRITAPRGRARQMNAGAARARGRAILFLHADTFLPENAFSFIEATLDDPRNAGGAFSLRFDSQRFRYRLMAWFVSARARVLRLPFGDQAIFCRSSYFRLIGGFADIPLLEDVEFGRRVRRLNGRLKIAPAAVTTSCRRLEREGVVRRVLTNWLILCLYAAGVHPGRLTRWYCYSPATPRQDTRGGERTAGKWLPRR